MKTLLNGLSSRKEMAKERITKFKKSIEILQQEEWSKKLFKKK